MRGQFGGFYNPSSGARSRTAARAPTTPPETETAVETEVGLDFIPPTALTGDVPGLLIPAAEG